MQAPTEDFMGSEIINNHSNTEMKNELKINIFP